MAWAHPAGGDRRVFERLVESGALAPDERPAPVADGQLLVSLLEAGAVDRAEAGDVMRELAQEQAIALATAETIELELIEKPSYMGSAPAFRINPFAMLLEGRKRAMSPDAVLAEAAEQRASRLRPLAGLGGVAGKIAPFVRGANLSSLLEDAPTLQKLRDEMGLDEMMTTLLALSLVDAGLAELQAPPEEAVALPSSVSAGPLPAPANTGIDSAGVIAAIEDAVLPNEILGVEITAELEEVERAYEERAASLSPGAIPGDLSARAEKAREKLERAIRTMRATAI